VGENADKHFPIVEKIKAEKCFMIPKQEMLSKDFVKSNAFRCDGILLVLIRIVCTL